MACTRLIRFNQLQDNTLPAKRPGSAITAWERWVFHSHNGCCFSARAMFRHGNVRSPAGTFVRRRAVSLVQVRL
jgi:hypothetical protein